jgi:RimJ/RimL family protein N-acetyltransferase
MDHNKVIPKWIETQRVYLRPYQHGDGEMLYAAGKRNRDHLSAYESDNFLLMLADEDHAETIIQELEAGWTAREFFFYGIFEKNTGVWLGQVYVGTASWDLPAFNIGYIADVNAEGLGYISEAVKAVTRMLFEVLGAHRIQADCAESNTRSWRLLERCGYKREVHLRDSKIGPNNNFHGDYIYSILQSDFSNQT